MPVWLPMRELVPRATKGRGRRRPERRPAPQHCATRPRIRRWTANGWAWKAFRLQQGIKTFQPVPFGRSSWRMGADGLCLPPNEEHHKHAYKAWEDLFLLLPVCDYARLAAEPAAAAFSGPGAAGHAPPHPCTYPPAASTFGSETWLVPVPPQPSCIGCGSSCWSRPVAHGAEPERA